MKFRSKLFCFFLCLSLVSTTLAVVVIYREASKLILSEIRSKILSLSATAVRGIDPKAVQNYIAVRGRMDSRSFQTLRRELEEIRDLQRGSNLFVLRVYIIHKRKDDHQYYFVMGTGETTGITSQFGQVLSRKEHIADLQQAHVSRKIYSTSQGAWMTGYAPILDANGDEVGLLGIDVKVKKVAFELKKLFFYGSIAFAVSMCVGIVLAYFLSKSVACSLSALCNTVKMIGKGRFSTRSDLHTRDEFNDLAMSINYMAQGLEERERLKVGLARYVSHYALEELLKLDKPITLEGERKRVTILFSDIRHFTTIAEKLPPEEVLKLLNEYFKEMIEVIFSYGGTLDKFIGDGLLAEFGAPLDDKLQELHAVLAAIQMHLRLKTLCEKWIEQGRPCFSMGIGIHTGLAVLGNIGSEKRMEYTAIGDTVNVASRLEGLTKRLHKPIIISQAVYEKVKDHFVFENLSENKLAGRMENVQAYAVHPEMQKNLGQFKVKHEM